jgi:hypothetical protein
MIPPTKFVKQDPGGTPPCFKKRLPLLNCIGVSIVLCWQETKLLVYDMMPRSWNIEV